MQTENEMPQKTIKTAQEILPNQAKHDKIANAAQKQFSPEHVRSKRRCQIRQKVQNKRRSNY